MLVKWILCQVDAARRPAFDVAQAAWFPIQEVDGFLGQCGGWQSLEDSSPCACILGLWSSAEHHADFLRDGPHDTLLASSGQSKTMRSWRTTLFSSLCAMPGEYPDLVQALDHAPEGAFLRVADCEVSAARSTAFRNAQEQDWLPAMRATDGMLGGMFSQEGPGRFLVTTLWKSAAHHQAYARDILPGCRERVAARGGEPDRLTGAAFPLEAGWTIPRRSITG